MTGRVFLLAMAMLNQAAAQPATSNIAAIESLIRNHDLAQAERLLEANLREHPKEGKLWTLDGITLALDGKAEKALEAFHHALEIQPNSAAALKGSIQILLTTGKTEDALPLLERLSKTNAADEQTHEMLAMLEAQKGECAKALQAFGEAGEAYKSHAMAVEAEAWCLDSEGRKEEAANAYGKVISLRPERSYLRYDLALLLFELHRQQEAADAIEPLLNSDQKDGDVLSLGAQIRESLGETPRAVMLQRQAIVTNPTEATHYVAFASLCLEHDSFDVGIDMLTTGIQHIPRNADLYLSRGVLYAQLGDFNHAEADFAKAQEYDTTRGITAYAADLSSMQRNNPELALKNLREQMKAHPEDPLLHLLLGQLLMNQTPAVGSELFQEAMQTTEFAAAMKPELTGAHDLLASMQMSLGNYDKAAEECRTSLRLDPTDEAAMYHLVISLRHAGKNEELPPLVKRLSEMHKESLKRETDRKKFRLTEPGQQDTKTANE